MTKRKTLTTQEAAMVLNLKSDSTIRRAVLEGRLKATKRGRDWYIRSEDLEAYRVRHNPKTRKRIPVK